MRCVTQLPWGSTVGRAIRAGYGSHPTALQAPMPGSDVRGLVVLALAIAIGGAGCTSGEVRGERNGESNEPEAAAPGGNRSGVNRGEAAARDSVVRLDSTSQRLVGIEVQVVGSAASDALVANGTITYNANRVSVVGPRVEGRIASVRADLGNQVRPGAVLAVIESPEVGQLRGELVRAQAMLEVTRQNHEREQRLFREQITSQKELLEADGAYRSAQADVDGARARLDAIGATVGEGAAFGLRSPVGGAVVERNASPGQIVGPSANLFTVADLRDVWITVDVYESDLARVNQGAEATVLPRALPDEEFRGRVTYAGGVLDSVTRSFKVRVQVDNPKGRLRPGMFALVRLGSTNHTARRGPPAVPQDAVQDLEGKQVIFTPGQRSGEFVARQVVLGPPAAGGLVTVVDGLNPGDRVVTKGAFQLKAELTKATFGEEE